MSVRRAFDIEQIVFLPPICFVFASCRSAHIFFISRVLVSVFVCEASVLAYCVPEWLLAASGVEWREKRGRRKARVGKH